MEQLKAERGKEEVVQRLYNWESSKKARMEEAQQAAPDGETEILGQDEGPAGDLDSADVLWGSWTSSLQLLDGRLRAAASGQHRAIGERMERVRGGV